MKRILTLMLVALMIIAVCAVMASCGGENNNTPAETTGADLNTEKNVETEAPEKEGLYLKTLGFDDDYYSVEDFDPEITEYDVALPKGNSRIPQVVATANDGITVQVVQAEISNEQTEGTASVTISDADGNTKTYTINMKRDISGGYMLVVGDECQFELGYLQTQYREGYTYESSHPEILSVDENGLMKALVASDEEITVIAKLNGVLTDTFIIDRIEKAE